MREFLGWAKWAWNKQEPWQKLWALGMFFLGMSLGAEGVAHYVLVAVPIAIFGFYTVKWMFWDTFQSSWAKYRAHRNELLTTIKKSEG